VKSELYELPTPALEGVSVKLPSLVKPRLQANAPIRVKQTTTRNNINLGRWTVEEDAKLTDAIKKVGKDWAAAAAIVPGRSYAQCRFDPDITLQ
jgi:hypothetical protein